MSPANIMAMVSEIHPFLVCGYAFFAGFAFSRWEGFWMSLGAFFWPIVIPALLVVIWADWFARHGVGPVCGYQWLPPVGARFRDGVKASNTEYTAGFKPGMKHVFPWEYLGFGLWRKREKSGWVPDGDGGGK